MKNVAVWRLPEWAKIMDMARASWRNLGRREKYVLFGGSVLGALCLLYWLQWSPQIARLREQIPLEKKTAGWMQEADRQLGLLQVKPGKSEGRIGGLEKKLRGSEISQHLSQVTPVGLNQLLCHFEKVGFDEWSAWLIGFAAEENVAVDEAEIKRINNTGEVSVDLVLGMD